MSVRVLAYMAVALGALAGCAEVPTSPDDAVCGQSTVCGPGTLLRGCPECLYARQVSFRLDACAGGLTVAETERSLAVDARFLATFEALPEAIRRATALTTKALQAPDLAFSDPGEDTTPDGFTYLPDGSYEDGSGLAVRFSFGKDYVLHSIGDPIVPPLFRSDSYLQGAVLIEHPNKVSSAAFDAPGPLVELLGQGADPKSPLDLGWSWEPWSQIVAVTVRVKAPPAADARVEYDIAWEGVPLQGAVAAVAGQGRRSAVSRVKLDGADPSQKAAITGWDMVLREVSPSTLDTWEDGPPMALRGEAVLTVKGGDMPHRTTLWLDGTSESRPIVTVECL